MSSSQQHCPTSQSLLRREGSRAVHAETVSLLQGYTTIGVPLQDDGSSWRRGLATGAPESAATELEEGGAMARSDLEPQDLAAIISVVEYAIANFR